MALSESSVEANMKSDHAGEWDSCCGIRSDQSGDGLQKAVDDHNLPAVCMCLDRSVDQALQLAAVDQGGDDAFVGDAEAGGQIGNMSGFVQGGSAAQIGGQGADEGIAGAGVVDCSGFVGWEVLVPAGSDQGAAALAQGDDDLAHPAVDEPFRLINHGSWSWYQGVQLVQIRDQDVD